MTKTATPRRRPSFWRRSKRSFRRTRAPEQGSRGSVSGGSPNLCAAAMCLDVVALVVLFRSRLVGERAAAMRLDVVAFVFRLELLFLGHPASSLGRDELPLMPT